VRTDPASTAHVTAPVLWDRETKRIVKTRSSEIIRMFESGAFEGAGPELYPAALATEIDAINDRVYETLNNGVYRCGFARSQAAYEMAFRPLFGRSTGSRAARIEALTCWASSSPRPTGGCFRRSCASTPSTTATSNATCDGLLDYPNLWGYTRELYQLPGVAATVELDEIKRHYYGTHPSINPSGIVPLGRCSTFEAPHRRG